MSAYSRPPPVARGQSTRTPSMSSEVRELLSDAPERLLSHRELQPLASFLGRAGHKGRDLYQKVFLYNERLLRAADEVIAALVRRQIPVQPLKGLLLLERLYRDPGARPMGDIDLLIPPAHIERAHEAMTDLGYVHDRDAASHHRAYRRHELLLEVHSRLLSELAIDGNAEEFFDRARSESFRGQTLAIAPPELHLYFVLAHAAAHALRYSHIWIIDAVLIARALNPDWSIVREYAHLHHASRAVATASRQVNAFFPDTFPETRPGGVRDRAIDWLAGPQTKEIPYGFSVRSLAVRMLLTDGLVGPAMMIGAKLGTKMDDWFSHPFRNVDH